MSQHSPGRPDSISASAYRLSQELKAYTYPPHLGIKSVELLAGSEHLPFSIHWRVEVVVDIRGRKYLVDIFSQKSLCANGLPQVLPVNSVVVQTVTAEAVAHAVVSLVSLGLDYPRDENYLDTHLQALLGENGESLLWEFEARPSHQDLVEKLNQREVKDADREAGRLLMVWPDSWYPTEIRSKLEAELHSLFSRWQLRQASQYPNRLTGSLAWFLHRPSLTPDQIVEGLLGFRPRLDIDLRECKTLAEEVFTVYQRFAPQLVIQKNADETVGSHGES